ncbi:uncharacterized protein METZ01_LOCUS180803 [marine metagenome]|uniref:Uncharacterized protein n=1 Tax=marine metagenome TaxID=408172 RepID=A0A382CQ05_9ZZZZ
MQRKDNRQLEPILCLNSGHQYKEGNTLYMTSTGAYEESNK